MFSIFYLKFNEGACRPILAASGLPLADAEKARPLRTSRYVAGLAFWARLAPGRCLEPFIPIASKSPYGGFVCCLVPVRFRPAPGFLAGHCGSRIDCRYAGGSTGPASRSFYPAGKGSEKQGTGAAAFSHPHMLKARRKASIMAKRDGVPLKGRRLVPLPAGTS